MGEVWLAEQLEPVRRRVAIKVIKVGMDTKQVVARFESERQALALMDHPAIAKVFDGGSTPEGRPFFVMEYVAGVPITEHCDTHKLPTEERLKLFTQVCEGVQHAHQKAIIHRDLKPSNILVALVDGHAQPKIIDFGIVKATGQRLTDKTLFTEVGSVIGTPEYMSPEQADLTGQDIDTRTDVYSLGVILYELLTGQLPFGSAELRSSSYEELRRKLREVDPPKPSTRVGTGGGNAADTAKKRETDPETLRRQVEGDLDAVVMKALEKDRNRRYGTPSELAADVQRHFISEPVLARPASQWYRIQKYTRRHRAGVLVATGIALLLVGFSTLMVVQTRRIAHERDRANVERDRANAERDRASRKAEAASKVTHLVFGMFEVPGSSVSGRGLQSGGEVKGYAKPKAGPATQEEFVHEALDAASRSVDNELAGYPEEQAHVLRTLAVKQESLGFATEAGALLERAVTTLGHAFGQDDKRTLSYRHLLADNLIRRKRFADAEAIVREVLAVRKRLLGLSHRETLQSMMKFGNILQFERRFAEAEGLWRETLSLQKQVLGPEDHDTLASTLGLSRAIATQGRLAEAEGLQQQVLRDRGRLFGPTSHETLQAVYELAGTLADEKRFSAAELLIREAFERVRVSQGDDSREATIAAYNFGSVLARAGKKEEALSRLRYSMEHGLAEDPETDLEGDTDLSSLHGTTGFEALVRDVKRRQSGRR